MPRTLGAALLGGAAAYMQGRTARRDQDEQERLVWDRNRIADERMKIDDARYQAQMQAQAEAMRATRERQAAQDARQGELDRMNAAREGMVETGRVQEDLQGLLGDAAPTMRGATYQIGGQSYTKARRPDAEVQWERQQQAQRDRDAANDAAQLARDKANRDAIASEGAKNRAASMAEIRFREENRPDLGQVVPNTAVETVANNARTLSQIDEAIAALESGGGRGHIGPWQRVIPNIAAQVMDPKGTNIRGMVANIGNLQYKDLSGAAVSLSEDKRLQPSVPRVDDTPEASLEKLRRLKKSLESIDGTVRGYYSPQNGYRPLPAGSGQSDPQKFLNPEFLQWLEQRRGRP